MLELLNTLLHLPLATLLIVIGVAFIVIAVVKRLGKFTIDLDHTGRIVAGGVGGLLLVLGVVLSIIILSNGAGSGGGPSTAKGASRSSPSAKNTVTSIVTVPPQGWYYAHVPGPGCDQSGGQWARSLDAFYYTCLSDSLRMTMKNSGFSDVLMRFSPPAGKSFPDDATATIDVFGFDAFACVDFGFEQFRQPDYQMDVCEDGTWRIDKTQLATTVASGTVAAQNGHFVLLETKTSALCIFFINGVQVATFQDAPNIPATDIIIDLNASTGASAQFTDFRITNQD
jgi:hypothetical protein